MSNPHSKLNYKHEFVECLLANIQNKDIASTISSLREINTMSPRIMAEPFRKNVGDAYEDDKYFAMYLALDTYYQHLIDVDFEEEAAPSNE